MTEQHAEVRKVGTFHGVHLSGSIELHISQGDQNVAIGSDDREVIDDIETVVENGILRIRYKKSNWYDSDWFQNGRKVRAYVSAPQINEIRGSGSGKIFIEGLLKAEQLKINLSGSGNLSGKVSTIVLESTQTGSSDITLSGKAKEASFKSTGSGNVKGLNLVIENCKIQISGSGNMKFTVNGKMSCNITGSGDIEYKGNGNITDIKTTGSGRVKKIES